MLCNRNLFTGDLNHIAPLISNFFLAAYCLINLSCFHATFVKAPGFRPAFRYYSMWLGFLGAVLCLLVMFIINWVTSLITFAVVSLLYLCIYQRKPDVNWGSSTQAQTYSLALNAVMKLNEVADHVKNYSNALDMHMSIGILRLPQGMDYSKYSIQLEEYAMLSKKEKKRRMKMSSDFNDEDGMMRNKSCSELSEFSVASCHLDSSRESSPPSSPTTVRSMNGAVSQDPHGQINLAFTGTPDNGDVGGRVIIPSIPDEIKLSATQFQRRQKKGFIDVWWLYDDGGLTMLIPHILSTRSQWSGCKLRIFALANKKDELDREQRNMVALLNKFRIDYSDVTVIPDIVKPPEESSKKEFEALITKWQGDGNDSRFFISESELCALKDKTNRHIRLSELLHKYSKHSSLIAMTLPMPRKSVCSAALYMAWLETLTKDMPPFLLIRGNQTSVLTFYS
ncbi:bumetanide-sensitive sodium-(potassium)-chloride cotransporter [Nephila pilipes]|uniref:Bumetanide-sensitive sodium-(Potassium)-chloride cotransporter n=1 Tax=Nephila pilipes TaxID=299642 RepID=A0A8X6M9X8_NEPPI|nr:bumetanide-sensitive sodium-(potassium)-chloride cotransporter [Nephila pilipes]